MNGSENVAEQDEEKQSIVDDEENAQQRKKNDESDDDDDGEEQDDKRVSLGRQISFADTKFLCPITKQIMQDPVICSDGFSYERAAIEEWLQTHDVSPVTKQKLSTKQLFPNENLKSMIREGSGSY
mmetsp:Transcript_573/g.816  ORF Transcript_573/g.816 Transcript_573/m.816 type:complete len:126 (+) Transcript_573:1-378(+)